MCITHCSYLDFIFTFARFISYVYNSLIILVKEWQIMTIVVWLFRIILKFENKNNLRI